MKEITVGKFNLVTEYAIMQKVLNKAGINTKHDIKVKQISEPSVKAIASIKKIEEQGELPTHEQYKSNIEIPYQLISYVLLDNNPDSLVDFAIELSKYNIYTILQNYIFIQYLLFITGNILIAEECKSGYPSIQLLHLFINE